MSYFTFRLPDQEPIHGTDGPGCLKWWEAFKKSDDDVADIFVTTSSDPIIEKKIGYVDKNGIHWLQKAAVDKLAEREGLEEKHTKFWEHANRELADGDLKIVQTDPGNSLELWCIFQYLDSNGDVQEITIEMFGYQLIQMEPLTIHDITGEPQ